MWKTRLAERNDSSAHIMLCGPVRVDASISGPTNAGVGANSFGHAFVLGNAVAKKHCSECVMFPANGGFSTMQYLYKKQISKPFFSTNMFYSFITCISYMFIRLV